MNKNILAGLRCPQCQSDGPFYMKVSIFGTALVSDDGFSYDDLEHAEVEFEQDSKTLCYTCPFEGPTAMFEVDA